MTAPLLPEMWPLHRIAKELGKASHVLVAASRSGTFPPVIRVGALWFVKAEEVRAWFDKNHAVDVASPATLDRVKAAGRASASSQRRRLPAQLRAHSASS